MKTLQKRENKRMGVLLFKEKRKKKEERNKEKKKKELKAIDRGLWKN